MKKYCAFLTALLLLLLTALPVWAAMPRMADEAHLLSETERGQLADLVNALSEKHNCDVVIVTVDSLEGKSAQAYADDYYDYHGYRFDGILLLVSMGEREWAMSTSGKAIDVFNDRRLEDMEDSFLSYLSDGAYYRAFTAFADDCDHYLTLGPQQGTVRVPERTFRGPGFGKLLFCIIVGLVAGFVTVTNMGKQLKSVGVKKDAVEFAKRDSLTLACNQDHFLYRNVSKRERPRDTSSSSHSSSSHARSTTHHSSSGRSHGGRSGKF